MLWRQALVALLQSGTASRMLPSPVPPSVEGSSGSIDCLRCYNPLHRPRRAAQPFDTRLIRARARLQGRIQASERQIENISFYLNPNSCSVLKNCLGVVDHARPGISRGRDSRGGVASNVVSDAAVGLDLRASVGRHLDRARPVPDTKVL